MKTSHTLALSLLAGVLTPATAAAHVKWFTDEDRYPLRTDLILGDRTLLMIASASVAVCGFVVLQRLVGDANWPNLRVFRRMAIGGRTILALQAAITIVAAASQGTLLVPNLPLPDSPVGGVVIGTEVFIAVTFVTGIWDWAGALALIALLPIGAIVCGPWDLLEQILWLGIASLIVVTRRNSSARWSARAWFARRDPACVAHACTLLRLSTGAAFIAVACGEKLWNPDLGGTFVVAHPMFNFLQSLGVSWFSNDLFVLLVGLTEATIGALLISGYLTRVVVLGMWLPFHLGIPLLPSQELIGHLPIFGIMYILLVQPSARPATIAEARRATNVRAPVRFGPLPSPRALVVLLATRLH